MKASALRCESNSSCLIIEAGDGKFYLFSRKGKQLEKTKIGTSERKPCYICIRNINIYYMRYEEYRLF